MESTSMPVKESLNALHNQQIHRHKGYNLNGELKYKTEDIMSNCKEKDGIDLVNYIASVLNEPKKDLIIELYKELGKDFMVGMLEKTLNIENEGGLIKKHHYIGVNTIIIENNTIIMKDNVINLSNSNIKVIGLHTMINNHNIALEENNTITDSDIDIGNPNANDNNHNTPEDPKLVYNNNSITNSNSTNDNNQIKEKKSLGGIFFTLLKKNEGTKQIVRQIFRINYRQRRERKRVYREFAKLTI